MCILGTQDAEVLSPPEAPPSSVICWHLLPLQPRRPSLRVKGPDFAVHRYGALRESRMPRD